MFSCERYVCCCFMWHHWKCKEITIVRKPASYCDTDVFMLYINTVIFLHWKITCRVCCQSWWRTIMVNWSQKWLKWLPNSIMSTGCSWAAISSTEGFIATFMHIYKRFLQKGLSINCCPLKVKVLAFCCICSLCITWNYYIFTVLSLAYTRSVIIKLDISNCI